MYFSSGQIVERNVELCMATYGKNLHDSDVILFKLTEVSVVYYTFYLTSNTEIWLFY